ncbi:MAG TPA: hypothetical protein PLE85_01655 [Bacteroidales bacterium]|nr:hypothetical protein [Bacteroidales bacterium]
MKRLSKGIIFIILMSGITMISNGCARKSNQQQQASQVEPARQTSVGPSVMVYKTRADYRQLVPVILSEDRKAIISFPAPGDVYYKGELALPQLLENGFLLDRRGIDERVAFIGMTYEEYSQLKESPTPEMLLQLIVDKDPIIEMYHCGSAYQYQDLEVEMLRRSRDNDWSGCRKIK